MKSKILTLGILAALVVIPVSYALENNSPSQSSGPAITETADPTAQPTTSALATQPAAPPTEPANPNQGVAPTPETTTTTAAETAPAAAPANAPSANDPPAPPVTNVSCASNSQPTGQDSPKYALYYDCNRSDGSTTHTLMGYANDPNFSVSP